MTRTSDESVPAVALGLLVVPACVRHVRYTLSAFAGWTASAVVALSMTMRGSAGAAVWEFRRTNKTAPGAGARFGVLVSVMIAVWSADPVFGIPTAGSHGLEDRRLAPDAPDLAEGVAHLPRGGRSTGTEATFLKVAKASGARRRALELVDLDPDRLQSVTIQADTLTIRGSEQETALTPRGNKG